MSVAYAEHAGPWTIDDVLAMPEDSRTRVELVGGSLMMSPGPGVPHQRASRILTNALEVAAAASDAPVEILEGINVVVPDGLLIPDIAIVDIDAAEAAGATVDAHEVLAVIEIASASTRVTDKKVKPPLYAAAGIARFWRVELDPAPGIYTATLHGGTYGAPIVAQAGEPAALNMGFSVEIDPAILARSGR